MTNEETLDYIDSEFEEMLGMAASGNLPAGTLAVFKMIFIAGMVAALSYPGDDEMLGRMTKPASERISKKYGNRKIFPFPPAP
jgi:hypothetical protein